MFLKIIKEIIWFRRNSKHRRLRKMINLGKETSLSFDLKVSSPQSLQIGDYVYIGPGAIIQALGGVCINKGTIIGPRLKIYSANHRFRGASSIPYDEEFDKKPVVIGENTWIGGDVIIVPGTIIGEGVIIGAGSVVSGTIAQMSIIAGNPVKVIGTRNLEEYIKLKAEDKLYLKRKKTIAAKHQAED